MSFRSTGNPERTKSERRSPTGCRFEPCATSFLFFCGKTKPSTKRQNAESDCSRRFSFPGHFSQYFRHFPAPAPTRRQLSVRRKNNCAPERDPQVSPGTPQKKVSNSHTLRSTAAKSEQPVFSGGARKTVAESAGELTDPEAQFRVVYANCANWPPFLNQHGMYSSQAII